MFPRKVKKSGAFADCGTNKRGRQWDFESLERLNVGRSERRRGVHPPPMKMDRQQRKGVARRADCNPLNPKGIDDGKLYV
jgi:hypothetical protein